MVTKVTVKEVAKGSVKDIKAEEVWFDDVSQMDIDRAYDQHVHADALEKTLMDPTKTK